MVTLDTWLLGWRPADLTNGFLPFLWGEGNRNYLQDPVFRAALPAPPEENMQAAIGHWAWQFANPAVTWKDLAFLRECTELPILLKGILRPDDARLAVEHGVQGVLVSNHGGRQVDGAVGALDALPEVVAAVDGHCEVLFDSGIRSGSDALKALALGARAVLLGRPYLWGMTLGGARAWSRCCARSSRTWTSPWRSAATPRSTKSVPGRWWRRVARAALRLVGCPHGHGGGSTLRRRVEEAQATRPGRRAAAVLASLCAALAVLALTSAERVRLARDVPPQLRSLRKADGPGGRRIHRERVGPRER